MKKLKIRENPVCEHCNRAPSEHVHHVVSVWMGGDPFSWDNLIALCYKCHLTETLRLRRIFGR